MSHCYAPPFTAEPRDLDSQVMVVKDSSGQVIAEACNSYTATLITTALQFYVKHAMVVVIDPISTALMHLRDTQGEGDSEEIEKYRRILDDTNEEVVESYRSGAVG